MIAELVATTVAERSPRIATVERWVNARPSGAVYVDYLQNIRGKTVAGVYSVRARPEPTVSTPLDWSELTDGLTPTAFTIDTVPDRLRERGDLWARGMRRPNSLDGVLGRG
jgi:bifunctional non-homologous end joining protein LigD